MSLARLAKKKNVKKSIVRRGSEKSYHAQIKSRIQLHPDYKSSTDEEITDLVYIAADPEELIKYFDVQDYLPEESVELADTVKVQLVLKYDHIAEPEKLGPVEMILRKEYGPLHAFIVVGDQILEWDWNSIVLPHGKPIKDKKETVLDLAPSTGTHDIVSELHPVKVDLLKNVVKKVAEYNKLYSYHTIFRNSQRFVLDILKALGLPCPPELEVKLTSYHTDLNRNKSSFVPEVFDSHSALDQLVTTYLGQFSGTDLEFIVLHYFMFHIVTKMKENYPLNWKCQESDCKMKALEDFIDKKTMSLNKYRTVRYSFYNSTDF